MRNAVVLGASLAVALLVSSALAADDAVKSGPQVGSRKIPPFNPLHCSGPAVDSKGCLV
jgi:hypothetical protein